MIGRCYGFRPTGDSWAGAYRMANQLVRSGLTVIWTQAPTELGGAELPAGSFLLPIEPPLQTGPLGDGWRQRLAAGLGRYGLELWEGEPGELVGYTLPQVRVAIYGEAGSPFPHMAHLTSLGFTLRPLSAEQIRNGDLSGFDVLVVPGGGLDGMPGQFRPLGEKGARAIAQFVAGGGGYLSSCAGSYLAATLPPEQVEIIGGAQPCMRLVGARPVNGLGAGPSGFRSPGIGVVRLANEAPEHPVMFGLPDQFPCTHYNGPFFQLDPEAVPGAPPPQALARLVGREADFTPAERFFAGQQGDAPGLLDQAIEAGAAAVVVGHLGKGAAVMAGSHPEFGLDPLSMAELGPQGQMLGNAVWWLALQGRPGPYLIPADTDPPARLAQLLGMVDRLRGEGGSAPLAPEARGQFGRTAPQVWAETLDHLEQRIGRMAGRWSELAALAAATAVRMRQSGCTETERTAWLEAWVAIGERRPGLWQQDYGYRGFLALLDLAAEQIEAALASLAEPGGGGARPFDLVARSYLSAMGTVVTAEGSLERAITGLDQLAERIEWSREGGEQRVT